ncbi:uncharacterized protein [Montipora capricornis]|uniref:uncharacterized protein n=1 Tax=Montipora capricornis TaxID=246305 RepID=UPI0035F14005
MFNQVLIYPDDQVYHRFLWRKEAQGQPTVYQWQRLNLGDKLAPDIAISCVNTLAKLAENGFPEAAKEIRENSYVDDIGGSKHCGEDAKHITKEIDKILAKEKFEIKAWNSNHKYVDQTKEKFSSFLGHKWDKSEDTISFAKQDIETVNKGLTKRNCLAFVAQLWDPMGFVSPVSIQMRIALQEPWSMGCSWDELLPDDLQWKWMKNVQVLNDLLKYETNRKRKPDDADGMPKIHGFCDAGEEAYGSVIFLRWKLKDNSYACAPILVKAIVAPLKKKSIPHLELMGCLLLVRIFSTIIEAVKFANIEACKKVFWIDSRTVLSWIRNSARVAEIQETVDVDKFRYIPSNLNPADALTRGIDLGNLENWTKGPTFLFIESDEIPSHEHQNLECGNEHDSLKEIKGMTPMKSLRKEEQHPKTC